MDNIILIHIKIFGKSFDFMKKFHAFGILNLRSSYTYSQVIANKASKELRSENLLLLYYAIVVEKSTINCDVLSLLK